MLAGRNIVILMDQYLNSELRCEILNTRLQLTDKNKKMLTN
jgi:hypothetical protein